MQLNNKSTGDYIRITGIDILKNQVLYTQFGQNGEVIYNKKHIFNTIVLSDYTNQSTIYTDLCYNTLISELYTDYVLEGDTQNWLSEPKEIRFFIPTSLIVEGVREQNDFNTVINNIIEDAKTDVDLLILDRPSYSVIYANTVSSENQSVIDPLIADETITVEQKIV